MNCAEALHRFEEILSGELAMTAKAGTAVLDHVIHCPSCTSTVEISARAREILFIWKTRSGNN